MKKKIRVIAHYLPQFHPIPENDEWWGKGFTEWTNVTKSKPKFEGHYQPHLPSDLGFTDLRLKKVCEAQENLAMDYGIHGFCYYHYWFSGRKILETPLQNKLKNPNQLMPFMVCWANHSWNRSWSLSEKEILLEQKYLPEDIDNHFFDLLEVFKDERYICIDDKPVFAIYDPEKIPNLQKLINRWQELALANGLNGLYLVCCEGWLNKDAKSMGFEASYQFFPNNRKRPVQIKAPFMSRLIGKLTNRADRIAHNINYVCDYSDLKSEELNRIHRSKKIFPSLVPGWDNSARRERNAMIVIRSTPEKFEEWLNQIGSQFIPFSADENLVFINAWNEWGEGAHLEPDSKFGRSYLEKVRDFTDRYSGIEFVEIK